MQYLLECKIVDTYTRPDNRRMSIEKIGARLDAAMKARNVKTQTRLATLSGVPQPTIARILKGGGRQGPETETLRPLANALQVHLRWLQEGLGPMDVSDGAPEEAYRQRGEAAADDRRAEQVAREMLGHIVDLVETYRLADAAGRSRIDTVAQRVRRELSTGDKDEASTS